MDYTIEDLPSILGSDLLQIQWQIPQCKNLKEVEGHRHSILPSVERFTLQEEFADVYMGVSEKEFFAIFDVNHPLEKTLYPEFKKGDAVELIIDTNPSKDQGITTRFVHHFVFLPMPYEGVFAKEITRFRGVDTRSLISDEELKFSVSQGKKSYKLSITIAKNSFKGFDENTKSIGVGYRVHRLKGDVQEFPHNSQSMHFDVHPGLLGVGILVGI
jgi:hypothetical protein